LRPSRATPRKGILLEAEEVTNGRPWQAGVVFVCLDKLFILGISISVIFKWLTSHA